MKNSFWDMYTKADLDAGRAQSQAADADRRARDTDARVQKLATICQAMWTLLQEKAGLNDEALIARVRELDLQDGVADDIATRGAEGCPKCARPLSLEHNRCLYCGHVPDRQTAFEVV